MTPKYTTNLLNMLDDIRATSGICPVCDRFYADTLQQAFIQEAGMCVNCDHLTSEADDIMAQDVPTQYSEDL